jgi:two-component system, NtrC family, response regulator HydG
MNSAGRILVVDDEPNAVKVLSAILANDGYDVSEATDGKSAIRTVSHKDIDN